jgi:hypothetical protein
MKYLPIIIFSILFFSCSTKQSNNGIIGSINKDSNINVLVGNVNLDCEKEELIPILRRQKGNLTYPICPPFYYDTLKNRLDIYTKFLQKDFDLNKVKVIVILNYSGSFFGKCFSSDYGPANGFLELNDTLKIPSLGFSKTGYLTLITNDSILFYKSNFKKIDYLTLIHEYYSSYDPESISDNKIDSEYKFEYFENVEIKFFNDGYECE